MNMMEPFLNAQMRMTLARKLGITVCEKGCLDEEGIPMGDWHLVILFLEKFAKGAETALVLGELKETLNGMTLENPTECLTAWERKAAAAFIDLLGGDSDDAEPFAHYGLGAT